MALRSAASHARNVPLWLRFLLISLALVPALVLPGQLRADYDFCYWTCYGYAQYCNPGDKAHVCCGGGGCQVISCVGGLCDES